MGAPIGNTNAAKGKVWKAAIERALDKRGKSRADALADLAGKLLDKAEEGDIAALRELADRMDGKAVQQIDAEFRGSLTSVIEALPMHRLRELPDKDEPELLPAPGNGQ